MEITYEKSIIIFNHLYAYKIRNWVILIFNLEDFEDIKSSATDLSSIGYSLVYLKKNAP